MLDWLLDVTFVTAGTDILLLAIVVLPLGFAAILRAAEAIKANPQKSNRAIAEEIGVAEGTVRAARNSGAQDYAPDQRVGREIIDIPSSHQAQAAR
jgi:hypothetical protein